MRRFSLPLIYFMFIAHIYGGAHATAETEKIRVGHFPNITHAPALIGRANGYFAQAFEPETTIEWNVFHAGPEAIEALFAGAIDLLYVGPNPAINGFIRSQGKALRILAGAASGGVAFVIRSDSKIEKFEDIRGKRAATPQKGNSQDVALLHLMSKQGLSPRFKGGDVELFHISGGDQMTAFLKKQVDAIWTVEPWVSRLVAEANGKILFEKSELWSDGIYATTLLIARKSFIDERPDLVHKWVKSHMELINWINEHLTEAKQWVNEELERETGEPLALSYLDQAFGRMSFTSDPMVPQVLEVANRSFAIGYLGRKKMGLEDLYDLSFLHQAEPELEKVRA